MRNQSLDARFLRRKSEYIVQKRNSILCKDLSEDRLLKLYENLNFGDSSHHESSLVVE